jgi:hypothetical protein
MRVLSSPLIASEFTNDKNLRVTPLSERASEENLATSSLIAPMNESIGFRRAESSLKALKSSEPAYVR